MTGAALMLRTYQSLTNVDLGFAPQNVLTVQIQTRPSALTRYRTAAQRSALHDQIKERVESLPGVMSVASGDPPLAPDEIGTWEFTLADRPAPRPDELVRADYNGVSPDYFETLSIRVLAGRTFTDADVEQQVWARGTSKEEGLGSRREVALPVIINETMARRYWPGRSAIGKGLYWGAQDPGRVDDEPGGWDERYPIPFLLTVVGIVPEMKTWGLDQEPQAQIYFPHQGF